MEGFDGVLEVSYGDVNVLMGGINKEENVHIKGLYF